jgi:hypothetical protein
VTKQADNGVILTPTVEAGVVNALQQECGETARDHGFSNDWLMADWLESLAEYLSKEERFTTDVTKPLGVSTVDGLQTAAVILRNNVLGTKLMLIVSELSEGLESLRENGGAAGALQGFGNFHEELADAIVRILDTGTFTKGNLGDELLKKMAINRDREHMHGKVM